MFATTTINDQVITPGLFLAPMAGVTNSAFRRLLADFGGCGALFTEMVSASAFLRERSDQSPFTKRRPEEGRVIYQFRISGSEDIEAVFRKAATLEAFAIDLNLGCPAPKIQQQASGTALFRDFATLREVLTRIRRIYRGTLTVKCRLGDDPERWREPFVERLRLFEDHDVHALTVHPRYSGEMLKRHARWREFPWIASQTRLPVIGNGDVCSPKDVESHREWFEPLAGLMLGRIAAVKPWIFREFAGLPPVEINHTELWERYYGYVLEDFPPDRAYGRLMEFTTYFAKNFFFGHELHKGIQKTATAAEVREAVLRFLASNPRLSASEHPSFF
jgi:tRNA-dihydrouridine synthase